MSNVLEPRERLGSVVSYWKKSAASSASTDSAQKSDNDKNAPVASEATVGESIGKKLWATAKQHVTSGTFSEMAKKNNLFMKSLWQLPYTAHWWQSVAKGDHRSAPVHEDTNRLLLDPAVVSGTLPNALKYFVLPNDQPEGVVRLTLLMDVGSLHETESELGYAHFLEHLAFRGTKRFPKAKIYEYLGSIGAALGADTNATTSFGWTSYDLTVPFSTPEERFARVQTVLDFFADIVCDVTFEEADVASGM